MNINEQLIAEMIATAEEFQEPSKSEVDPTLAPKPLPSTLAPVAAFEPRFLPNSLAPWVMDIADRMQCPPDYVAMSALVAAGGIIGNRMGIRPKMRSDWIETPNLWGMIIGTPGSKKSPAMAAALRPLHRLEADAAKANSAAMAEYVSQSELFAIKKASAKQDAAKAVKEGKTYDGDLGGPEPQEPIAKRYIVADASYEKLGEILKANPAGVTVYRDELGGLLSKLDQDDSQPARSFFLSAWGGQRPYVFDRIGRGTIRIERACLSMIGAIQPDAVAQQVGKACRSGGDGMIQRFSLAVWPDALTTWENIDGPPNADAQATAYSVYERLAQIDPPAVGATSEGFDGCPSLRFSEAAYELFVAWQTQHEADLRSGHWPPAVEGHFSKYRKMVPALALIQHLADGATGPVSDDALERALWLESYLKTHAMRLYGSGPRQDAAAARAILNRIKRRDLEDGFTARDIYQKDWAGLSDREHVQAGLALLCDYGWLTQEKVQSGGKPKTVFTVTTAAWGKFP